MPQKDKSARVEIFPTYRPEPRAETGEQFIESFPARREQAMQREEAKLPEFFRKLQEAREGSSQTTQQRIPVRAPVARTDPRVSRVSRRK
jgi:hypothetical protein